MPDQKTAGDKKYKRILLKLSGEELMGDEPFGIDPRVLERMALEIGQLVGIGVQVGLVIGGGNLFRGAALHAAGIERVTGDHMGMLATVMNALAMRDALERTNISARIMSAIPMSGVVEHYDRRNAGRCLANGEVVIFAAGTGNPFFTTDSAACLRGIEVGADLVLKATKVDGVYSDDPLTRRDTLQSSDLRRSAGQEAGSDGFNRYLSVSRAPDAPAGFQNVETRGAAQYRCGR